MSDPTRGEPIGDESIATLLSRVVADAEHVARAEIEVQKAKVGAKVGEARTALVFLVGAVAIGSLALVAFVVGMLMVLAPLVGPGGATAIVVGSLLLVSGMLGWLAMRHFKRLFGQTAKLP